MKRPGMGTGGWRGWARLSRAHVARRYLVQEAFTRSARLAKRAGNVTEDVPAADEEFGTYNLPEVFGTSALGRYWVIRE
jgi:hypothetical protein